MSGSRDSITFALVHAGLRCGPGMPVDTAKFVAALAEHGFEFVEPQFHGPHWLESTVEHLVRAGWGWPSPDQPAAANFCGPDAMAELEADNVVLRHVDDPTEEDILLRGVSDEALLRELRRRGLDLDDPEPTTGPTP